MEDSRTDLLPLLKAMQVLEPYLDEIVLVGGWVPLLYRRYGYMSSPHPLLRTIDIDIVVPGRVEDRGRPTIDQLLSRAGYEPRVHPSDDALVKYELASPVTEIEFLTPEIGRPGRATRRVQQGLTAQALRYLQILLENTVKISIDDTVCGSDISLTVTVPSPGAFIYQKGLTLSPGSRRETYKLAKDLYYILNIADCPGDVRDSIATEVRSFRSRYPAGWFDRFVRNLIAYFPESAGEGAALVTTQYSGSMPASTFRNYAHRVFREFIQGITEGSAS